MFCRTSKRVVLLSLTLYLLWLHLSPCVLASYEKPSYSRPFARNGVGYYEALFKDFARTYNKTYHLDDLASRFETFKQNLQTIERHNKANSSYQLSMNRFGDMTHREFRRRMLGYSCGDYESDDHGFKRCRRPITFSLSRPRPHRPTKPDNSDPNSTHVDWRDKHVVSPVYDQGNCGSCWAFSAVGALESAHAISSGKLVELSKQQLLDCSTTHGNAGCQGGDMDTAFKYVQESDGLCSEADYPYAGKDQGCHAKGQCKPIVKLSGFIDVEPSNQQALTEALLKGPVCAAVEARHEHFQFYKAGVFEGACGNDLDHGILVVGFGIDQATGKPYYLVKNSWGVEWGEQGYMKLSRSDQKGDGACGIAMMPSYPVVAR